MNNYLVVADDFTGANDTGVQIRRRGIPVDVVFSFPETSDASLGGGPGGTGSLVLDTESRFLSEAEAYENIIAQGEKIPFGNFRRIIKKVDSTLRGNIAAETLALDHCYKAELIIFAPAFPDMGRTTVKRIHHINGKPIGQTELAKDPKTPVKIDDIHSIMAASFSEEIIHVDLDALRGGKADLGAARIYTFDAETNDDLLRIVKMVLAKDRRVLWVGCAGLADILLRVDIPLPPVLAVLASLSSVTRKQVHYAEGQGIELVKIPLYEILEETDSAVKSFNTVTGEIARKASDLLKQGRDIILLSSSTYSEEEYQKTEKAARRAGISTEEMSVFTQDTIGQIALSVMDSLQGPAGFGISGLLLSGGDTAISCFQRAGATGSSIESEIAAGLPLMKLLGGRYDGLRVVTKAGAFGSEDAVYYGMRRLREA